MEICKRKRWSTLPILLLLAFLAGSSCEGPVLYTFKVNNASGEDLNLSYQTARKDTSILIEQNTQKLIYAESQLNSGKKAYFTDTIFWFLKLEIRSGTTRINKDPRLVEHWEFAPAGGDTAVYQLKLRPEDFR